MNPADSVKHDANHNANQKRRHPASTRAREAPPSTGMYTLRLLLGEQEGEHQCCVAPLLLRKRKLTSLPIQHPS